MYFSTVRVIGMFEIQRHLSQYHILMVIYAYRKGRVDQLFTNYEKFFDYAMGEYLELHYPCCFVNSDGRRCQVVKARHLAKGHQDDKGIIAAGDYEASFEPGFVKAWKSQLRMAIDGIHRDFSYELEQASQTPDIQAIPEERIALDLHAEYLNQFFEAVGPAAAIRSHATCFCCLMDVPEHPLPCGHVLCTACVRAYGKPLKSAVALNCCPLHREATNWVKAAHIKFKPAGAGVRILSLDGGGIRGIVQLEVLRAIEQSLGGYLPVQNFFDLIVGTGTGGMLGAALAMRDRTVDSCIDMFCCLCDHAFTPRLKGMPIINQIAQVFGNGPKFKTKPLYSALKTAFGDDDELFGPSSRIRPGSRVALTTTSVTGRESIVLASYRRPEDSMPVYSFERPHEPDMELKTWEGVAAALATPGYFRRFDFHGKTYLDGALRCPNPAFVADRERKLIWPDTDEPDLFLSLGTGQNRIMVLNKLSDRPKEAQPTTVIPQPGQTLNEARKASSRWRARRVDDVLDAESAWTDFRDFALREKPEAKGRRFIRFNPDLDREPPAGDSKGDIEALQMNVRKRLQTPHRLAALRNVAHRLVASSFYLQVQAKAGPEKTEQMLSGVISCRFDDGSMEMMALGKILADRRGQEFEPYFLVKPDMDSSELQNKVFITENVIRGMTDSAVFGLPNVYIPLRDQSRATSITLFLSAHDGLEPDGFTISGFPKVILGEIPGAKHRRKTTRMSSPQHSLRGPMRNFANMSIDGDALSLNGSTLGRESRGSTRESRDGRSSEDSWQQTQARMAAFNGTDGKPKMSLADIIAQNQGQGSSIKQRTNRFWTYIGNNHMAQHPEMYTADELAQHGISASGRQSASPPPNEGRTPAFMSPTLTTASTRSSATQQEVQEHDETRQSIHSVARELPKEPEPASREETEQDRVARKIRAQYQLAAAHNSLRPSDRDREPNPPPRRTTSLPTPDPDPNISRPPGAPSSSSLSSSDDDEEQDPTHRTSHSDDNDNGNDTDTTHTHYSGQAVQAQFTRASPVVQVRIRNSLDSILSMYSTNGSSL